MRNLIYQAVLISSLLLVLLTLAACGGDSEGEADTPSGDLPAGSELISKMSEAVNSTNSATFSADFQFATVAGAVTGSFQFWGERPDKTRAEVQSEEESLNGMQIVTNGEKGWTYSPNDRLVLVSTKNQLKTQLNEQPELREILEFAEKLEEQGVETAQAQTLGTETVNGRETYKVEAKYDDPDLQDLTITYYIDKETSFPQKADVKIDRDGVTVSGFVVATGEISTGGSIDAAKFTFTPPEGVEVQELDLTKLPTLPDMSGFSDVFSEE